MAAAAAHPVSTLRKYATAFEAALTVCLARPKPGPVHDLRSASRRIEAQLELLALVPSLPRHAAEKRQLLKHLAKLRRAAGIVRDLDIEQRLLAGFPHDVRAARLRAALREQRDSAAADLVRLIERRQAKTSAALELLLKALKPAEDKRLTANQLLRLTDEWFQKRSSAHSSSPDDEDSLHDIRKAAKLARYLAESAPGSPAKAAAARYERMQKTGGHWHDWLQLSKLDGIGKKTALATHIRDRISNHLRHFRAALPQHPTTRENVHA